MIAENSLCLQRSCSPSVQTLMVQIFDFSYDSDFWLVWYTFILDGDSMVDFRDLFVQLTGEFFLPSCFEGVCSGGLHNYDSGLWGSQIWM